MYIREVAVRLNLLLFLAALFAGSIDAATLRVKLQSATSLNGTLLAEPADERVTPVRVEVIVPSEVAIELPDDAPAWTLSLQSTGGWAAPQVVSGNRAETVVFDVFPTATLEFRPKVPADLGNRAFRVTFQSADENISGATECVRDGRTVTCAIVALPVDIRIAAEGLVPHYLWSVAVPAGKTRSEGVIAFAEGASLSGYVRSKTKGDSLARTSIELAPERAARLSDEEDRRAALAASRVQPAKNGFFQFRGLRPGAYVLTAVSGSQRSAATKVTIHANLEAQLKVPLLLQPPFGLHVSVMPPVQPSNQPWMIELKRRTGAPNEIEDVARHASDAAGLWQATDLTAGEYLVSVARGSDGFWFQKEISLNDETRMVLPIELVKVIGKVELGETALTGARVTFRGGNAEIPVRVRETGEFRAYLPQQEDELWPEVEVVAEEPKVRATFNDVIVKPLDGAEIARVLLKVSERGVHGRVLDSDGNPTREAAMIYLMSEKAPRFLEIETDEAGEFSIHGLADGVFHLRAAGRNSESSSVPVTIEADQQQAAFVELRLQARKTVRGVIRSGSGPVAGARITALPDERSTSLSFPYASDAEGRFEVPLNATSEGVTLSIAAPGFAFRLFRTHASSEPLVVDVDQTGGRLIVEIPADDRDRWGGEEPVFVHGAAYTHLGNVAFSAGERLNRTEKLITVTLPLAEPGEYSICWKSIDEWNAMRRGLPIAIHAPGRCTTGYLAPFSELRLRSAPPPRNAKP